MNPQPEQLHEVLERHRRSAHNAWQSDQPLPDDPEVRALARLARSLQTASALQTDPDFARQLERRILAHNAARQRQHPHQRWWEKFLPRLTYAHPALALALGFCLLFIFLGAGVLVAAAQVTNPNNPLYAIKQWEQQIQGSPTGAQTAQAEQDVQAARDQLNLLPSLANAAHAGDYRHALADFDQQLRIATQAINALPAGQDHTRLAGELAALQLDARHMLRGLLLQLAVPERLATTDELGRLGDTVPHLTAVDVTFPAHPNGSATIRISGDNLQAGAALLVDGHVAPASGTLQQGGYLFTATWNGNQHPHSIGIMNPDGTVAQTTALTLHSTSSNGKGGGGGNGNGGSNDKGNSPRSFFLR
jgi:hypothetical protein